MRRHRRREWIALLLLPALAFRLLVPAGFMPDVGADGSLLTMQMCHGDARSAAVVRLAGNGEPAPDDRSANHDAPCVFAATTGVAPPPDLDLDHGAWPTASDAFARPPVSADLPATHRLQSARAPPYPV